MPTFAPPHNRILRVCVTTVAVGRTFPQKAERLRQSLAQHDPWLTFAPFINHYPKGTPVTKETTYAFKPLAIQQRLNEGYDVVLWLDSAFVATTSVTPMIAIAKRNGHMVLNDGMHMHRWSTDRQLHAFGLSRRQAENVVIPLAGVCAFSARKGSALLQEWVNHIDLFRGSRTNRNNECSEDNVCRGSRHDQTVLGLIMRRAGQRYTNLEGMAALTESRHKGLVHHYPAPLTWGR